MKVFHNIHDKFSRDYVELYGDGLEIIDWYGQNGVMSRKWINVPTNPSISMFPGILIETTEELSKVRQNSLWSTIAVDSLPSFIYPTSLDWNLNLLK